MVQAHELMRQNGAGIDEDRSPGGAALVEAKAGGWIPAVAEKTPEEIMEEAIRRAKILAKHCHYTTIGTSKHIHIESWQLLGRFDNMVAGSYDSVRIEIGGIEGAKARCYVRNMVTGQIVTESIAYCMRDEKKYRKKTQSWYFPWKDAPWFQVASMAQTRGMSKALASVERWIAELGGFSGTPAEEMDGVKNGKAQRPDEKAMLKRIEGIGNGFELRNWEKKHQTEIKALSPAIQKKIADALTKRRAELMQSTPKPTAKPMPNKTEEVDELWGMILQMANGDKERAMKVLSRYMKKAGRNPEGKNSYADLDVPDKNCIRPYVEADFNAQNGIKDPHIGLGIEPCG